MGPVLSVGILIDFPGPLVGRFGSWFWAFLDTPTSGKFDVQIEPPIDLDLRNSGRLFTLSPPQHNQHNSQFEWNVRAD